MSAPVAVTRAADPTGATETALPKVGFVHIPKCAGTALGQALYAAFGTRPLHVSCVVAKNGRRPDPHSLERGSLAWRLACAVPFLSGHIPLNPMRQLRRDHIFTVMRDPALRYFSIFSYFVSRAEKPKHADSPAIRRYAGMSFMAFDRETASDKLAKLMVGDALSLKGLGDTAEDAAKLDAALLRFDGIYSGDLQSVASRVAAAVRRPAPQVQRMNESRAGLELEIGCSASAFLDRLRARTSLDARIFDRATALFPQTCLETRLDDDALLAQLHKRYRLVFR